MKLSLSLILLLISLCSPAQNSIVGNTSKVGNGSYGAPAPAAAGGGGGMWPTNISGAYPYLWATPSISYTTNSGIATLANLTTNGSALDITNAGAASTFPNGIGNDLNGFLTINFDGSSKYLKSVNYTSPQPHEVIMLLAATNNGGLAFYQDGSDATYRNYTRDDGTASFVIYAGNSVSVPNIPYQKWMVVDVQYNGNSNSRVYTNMVDTGAAPNIGTGGDQGITLGSGQAQSFFGKMKLMEIVTYTNQTLSTTVWNTTRSNLFYYFTNRYNLNLPD